MLVRTIEQQKSLIALLLVAEILSGELQMDVLIQKIMNRACDLIKCDYCSLFMVHETSERLMLYFAGGLTTTIEILISAGIVGYTVTTGEVLNIKDDYEDSFINS
jgi:signal transduction protein with GAF and PtsI domain